VTVSRYIFFFSSRQAKAVVQCPSEDDVPVPVEEDGAAHDVPPRGHAGGHRLPAARPVRAQLTDGMTVMRDSKSASMYVCVGVPMQKLGLS